MPKVARELPREALVELGVVTDSELSQRYGVTRLRIREVRHILGIDPAGRIAGSRSRDEAVHAWLCEQYVPASNVEIAAALGEDPKRVQRSLLALEARELVIDVGRRQGRGIARMWVALDPPQRAP